MEATREIIVAGAGAAGMMAAVSAAEAGEGRAETVAAMPAASATRRFMACILPHSPPSRHRPKEPCGNDCNCVQNW